MRMILSRGLFRRNRQHRSRTDSQPSSSISDRQPERIEIYAREDLHFVAFLAEGKCLISKGSGGKLQCWQVEDGKKVGMPMAAESPIFCFAVSQDRKWIASGSTNGLVTLWNATSCEKVREIKGHNGQVYTVDMTSDGSRIASGGGDGTVSVWSASTGQRLLRLEYPTAVAGVMFSPGDGQFIATATWTLSGSVRIYDTGDGHLIAKFPIAIYTGNNQSLVWASNSRRLFVSSSEKCVYCLDASACMILWTLPHDLASPRCISLASNDTVLVITDDRSVTFWDTTTLQNIGPVVEYNHPVHCLAISPNLDIAAGGPYRMTLQNLHDVLPAPYNALDRQIHEPLENGQADPQNSLGEATESLRVEDESPNTIFADLVKTIEQLRSELAISERKTNEQKDKMNEIVNSQCAEIHSLEANSVIQQEIIQKLRNRLSATQQHVSNQDDTINSLRDDLDAKETELVDLHNNLATTQYAANQMERELMQIIQCDELYARGSIYNAIESLVEITDTIADDPQVKKSVMGWRTQFTEQCISRLILIGDQASSSDKPDEALKAYSAALSLTSSPSSMLLTMWTRKMLISHSPKDVSDAATKFALPRFCVHQAICDVLQEENRIMDAIEFFQRMMGSPAGNAESHLEGAQWESDFRQRCIEKLKKLGDKVIEGKKYGDAIGFYAIALSLEPIQPNNIIVKCCEVRKGFLEDQRIDDAQVIETNPSSFKDYWRKYTALHRMGRYTEAFETFERMLSAIENSVDPEICKLRGRYINATPLIRRAIEDTICDTPRVLVDVDSGRLFDKSLQVAAFEAMPVYNELRSSMITHDRLDCTRIRSEVEKFYEYAMFSHTWEPLQESTFQMLENKSIDDLSDSRGNNELRGFRDVVRSRRFRWCWSDTCCVNPADRGVQQESVVAMFRWYGRSAVTVVHLHGVLSGSEDEDLLWKSIWNTRGWTYQEYVASPVVQFYTEDWKPYRGLTMWNHKESPIIRSEMERATRFNTRELVTLGPGLERVREKLYLASRRETTRGEDVAYCLFGIFGISISVIYGEGKEAAVRRLLQYILTNSDNVTLLSWTGNLGNSSNSYLPSDLTVYDQITPPHAPRPVQTNSMDHMVKALQSSVDVTLAVELYEQLYGLPTLSLVAGRLKLPGLVFPFSDLSRLPEPDSPTGLTAYLAMTPLLGEVVIRTKDDLSGMNRLLLIHPWIGPLLDEDFSGDVPLFDVDARALRLLVRLQQPFGGLLLAPLGRVKYKRVATDSLIQVQIRGGTSLRALMGCIRTVDLQ